MSAETALAGRADPVLITARTLVDALEPQPEDARFTATFRNSAGQERTFTCPELRAESLRRARVLAGLGLEPQSRIALLLFEEADVALWFLAGVLAGLVPVLVAPRNATRSRSGGPSSLSHIVASSGTRVVLTTATLKEDLARTLDGLEVRVIPVESLSVDEADDDAAVFAPCPATADDICYLQYTSGSTNEPKGTIITHGNLIANVRAGFATAWADGPHHFVGWMPLHHDFGLVAFFLAPLIARMPMTLLSSGLFVRWPEVWLDVLHRCRATVTGAPNFAFGYLLRRLRNADVSRYDLSRLRVLFCGGEPIQRDAFQAFADRLAPAKLDPRCFLPSYGLAESTVAVTIHPTWQPLMSDRVCGDALRRGVVSPPRPGGPSRILVSCGHPLPDHKVEVVAEDGIVLPEGRVGEIRISGPSVSPGYFGNPKATRESWRDGWFHTGDLGYLKAGQLYVCGRIKDLIIIRGANHYPQDFEWTIVRMNEPRARTVAAFPVDGENGESFAILVEADLDPEPRERFRARIIETIIQEHGVAPADVLVVHNGSLPLTTSGKVQRRRSRQMFERGEFADQPVAQADPA
jgi:fatty-acyl-CoA synthase